VANPRIADQIVDLSTELVEAAQQTSFEIWRRDVALLVDLLDQDGGYDPARDLASNRARLSFVGADRLVLSAELTGEHALAVAHALNVRADRLFRAYRTDQQHDPDLEIPPRSTLLALALAELVREGHATNPATTRAPAVDVTLVIHADGDPRGDADDPASNNADTGGPPEEPTQAVSTDGPANEPSRQTTSAPAPLSWLSTVDGTILACTDRYAHLVCDPAVTAMVVDALGVPLDLGRTVRLANPAQRRALAVRDGGCVFPGCDAPASWCDAHHVEPFEHGGGTDIATLALLCRRHHGVTHRHGWAMTATPRQTFTWTTPSGRALHSQRHLGRSPDG
jgi:hypothetical protein